MYFYCYSKILKIDNSDTIMMITPVTFDPSVVELFLALYNGCTLCILDKHIKEDPQRMLDIIFPSSGVTVLQTTPSIFKRWSLLEIREKVFHTPSHLKAILLGDNIYSVYLIFV